MLVLQRKRQQKIDVVTESGEQIVITVVGVKGDKVRLGFDASRGTKIHRREISLKSGPPRLTT